MKKAGRKILELQLQNISLLNKGFNRKRFEYKSFDNSFFAVNSSKNTYFALLSTFFGSMLMFGVFIIPFVLKEKIVIDFIVAYTILFVIGILCLRQFLWLVNGKQELTIEDKRVTLTKKGTFWTKTKQYHLSSVTNVREAFAEEKMSDFDKVLFEMHLNRKIIFSHITGAVIFDYKGETIKLFCDLNKKERVILINEMNKLL